MGQLFAVVNVHSQYTSEVAGSFVSAPPLGYNTALVQSTGTAELEDVIKHIIQQGSTVTRPDIVSVLEDFFTAIESMVLEGMNVNTPSANYGASIKGIFDGQADGYDPSRHQIAPKVTAGKRYRKAIKEQAQAAKQEAVKPKPNPLEYTDINSGERNSVLSPGGMGQVIGHRLKFDPADPEQSVFFMAPDGSSSTRVDVVGKNKPGELMFMVPDSLSPGDYMLVVRAGFGEDDVRIGALETTLTVAA